jgi:short-subunit dehydrogenase
MANAGKGLGKGFLDQDFAEARKVVDTNIVGTIYLVQQVGNLMRSRGQGRILLTGSIAGFMPGSVSPSTMAPRPSSTASPSRCGKS